MFKPNDVIKITYFCISGNKRKIFKFIGLCISFSKKHNSFIVKNIFNKENIQILFKFNCPNIFKIELLKNYNFNFKKSKLYFKKNTFLKQPPYKNKLLWKFSFKDILEPASFILPANSGTLDYKKVKKKFRF